MTASRQESYIELAELAGSFIHEIKNHLNTLMLNLQLLEEDFSEPQNHQQRLVLDRVQGLTSECRRVLQLSNDFLRFARINDLHQEPSSLNDVISRIITFIEPTARAQNIDITYYPDATIPELPLDREMFEKVLLNLLLNAEDALPEGGTITILTRQDADQIAVDIIDDGVGIAADVIPKLFRPFVTTKPQGNGLGLATSRKIILAHGGDLRVRSEPGRGTCFTITLPRPEEG